MDKQLRRFFPILFYLIVFHVALSIIMHLIASSPYLSDYHNSQGSWHFASDSNSYHNDALILADFFKRGDYWGWWNGSYYSHAKWIALSYVIFVRNQLSFAPVNAVTWILGMLYVYGIARKLFPERQNFWVLLALIFGLWPSYLLHTTQLLKEPFFVLGMLMMIWGWVGLLLGRRAISLSLHIGLGVLLVYLARPHILEAIACLSFLTIILVFWRARRVLAHAFLAIALIGSVCVVKYHRVMAGGLDIQSEKGFGIQSEKGPGRELRTQRNRQGEHLLSGFVDEPSRWAKYWSSWISSRRGELVNGHPDAGSFIDTDVHWHSTIDMIKYVPRAAQIGFLAPFPKHWFENAKHAGNATRRIAGLEMMCWYVLFPGFLYFIITGSVPVQVRIWLFIYSVSMVSLLVLVYANIGALFRLRYIFFLPIMIGGLEQWTRWQDRRIRVLKEHFSRMCQSIKTRRI